MRERLDAVEVSDLIRQTYLRYLRTLLPVRDASLNAAIREALRSGDGMVKGPLLEATPPYATSASLGQLIAEGVLSPWLERIGHAGGIPLERPLYRHQERAVRKVVAGDRNVVVATGTGSGKTESFMLPILQHLAGEAAAGSLEEPGVRALLLYPMNALANDQLKRLRELLAQTPEITFGRYTGETEQEPDKARAEFDRRHSGQTPLDNELLSREEIQQAPPHLLITNYAMLEYLLLRPRDTALFDGPTGRHWRFIVMDEAHVYDGASGIEVAMLLRRLRDRVAQTRSLTHILTSATVGGMHVGPRVAEFGQTLVGAPFEYDPDDPTRQDVVWAERDAATPREPWGPLPPEAYQDLVAADDREQVLGRYREVDGDLAGLLASETRIQRAERLLGERPWQLQDIARELFGDAPEAVDWTGHLISLGASTRHENGAPVIPARYHLWARAAEGAYACLDESGPHVHLARHEDCASCASAVFEVGSCKRCAATYLVGSLRRVGDVDRFVPPLSGGRVTWLVLLERDGAADVAPRVDEDEAILEELDLDPTKYTVRALCVRCGQLTDGEGKACKCGGSTKTVLEVDSHANELKSCGLCGGRSVAGQIRRLESGTDASVAVLSTSLYQALPPDSSGSMAEKPGEGRKLLFFADSRQDAAYFSPYLEDSYADLVRLRVTYEALEKVSEIEDDPLLDDVAHDGIRIAQRYGVFNWRAGAAEKRRKIQTWVHGELISTAGSTSLEGLGLVAFDMRRPPGLRLPQPLLELGLDDGEGWALVRELLRSLRSQGAVTFPDGVAPDDDVFQPRTGPIYVRLEGPEPRRKVLSWLPGRGQNGRLDYIRRLLRRLGSETSPEALARGIWRWLTEGMSEDRRLLQSLNPRGLGVVWALDHTLITARLVTPERPVYRCDRCQRLTPWSIREVCPTLGCTGKLHPWSPPSTEEDDHHYRALARTLNAVPLAVSEHTAQLSTDEAAAVQQRFLDGDLNALSCSTTFELGVDVGELQSVVLRNVPPTTANYVQRAGRAGRRTDSAALVLTYAQGRSHDLTYFSDPVRMIQGEVRPPRVSLRNERIAARHVNAVALAAYFRDAQQRRGVDYRKTADLFGDSDEDEQLMRWLRAVPDDVVAAARRVVPESLHDFVGLTDGSWADRLATLIETVAERHRRDVETYRDLERDAVAAQNYRLAAVYQRVINTFERRHLLGELAAQNILPKYGFPVDTVAMQTSHVGTDAASRVELSRDLRLAISDYAPGSQLVAGGFLWESGGVYRFPDREFPSFHYAACRCGWYEQAHTPLEIEQCPACGASGRRAPRTRKYIEPEFGFVATKQPPTRPKRRPRRVYRNTVHLVSRPDDEDAPTLALAGSVALRHQYVERGELVVINAGFNDQGYRICSWCGAGEPARPGQRAASEHEHPLTGRPCRGTWTWTSLGHTFQTDVLELRFEGLWAPMGADAWWGVLYALVEAAADQLEIARDDVDGTLHFGSAGNPALVLFDDVPAGAGHVGRIRDELEAVVKAAYKRVVSCECGPQTSCYRCLRNFRNQRLHDRLRRGAVANLLAPAVGDVAGGPAPSFATVSGADVTSYDGEIVSLTFRDGSSQAGKLWVETEGGQVVSCMLEVEGNVADVDPDDVARIAVAR